MIQSNKQTAEYPERFDFRAIGSVSTPFKQKFGIPRQSHALSKAKGIITFSPDINPVNACRGLDAFTHLWLTFVFHENIQGAWKDTVRPPRLGGNEKVGVFATRSTFRPNPIGLSLVKNNGLNQHNQLEIEGVDLLDGTPILDIKPYIQYADTAINPSSGFAEIAPAKNMAVEHTASVKKIICVIQKDTPEFASLLQNVLEQDPRPAYKKEKLDDKVYSMRLFDYDVKWRVDGNTNIVIDIDCLVSDNK